MNNRQTLAAFLISLFAAGLVLAALPISHAQNTAIFGYPYETTQAGGSGAKYDAYGSRFTLKEDASINSISALMSGGWNPTGKGDRYIYRFAIYSDDNGEVGALISQTETQTFIGAADIAGYSQGIWQTASFAQTLHLSSGSYWLMAVHNATNYISIHDEVPAKGYTTVTSVIGGMDFPASLNAPLYSVDYVLCLYASGEGSSSVLQPIVNYTRQLMTHLSVGCTTDSSSLDNKIEITGNLSANRDGIASAPILLSYAEDINATWQPISTANTGPDGTFTATWYPTSTGNYVINATYPGDSTHTPTNTIVNVIVTSVADHSNNVFSVDSNSTVTNLGFNSETNQLCFSVTGESGTTGYAEIYIAKSLVEDPSQIQASIDGAAANFTVSSTEDSWVLYFSYHHSSHNIIFNLARAEAAPAPEMPRASLPLVIVALVAIAVALVATQRKRR